MLQQYLTHRTWIALSLIAILLLAACGGEPTALPATDAAAGATRETLATLPEEAIHPPRLVTGHDLIALGYRPGPLFSTILTRVEDAQLEGEAATREDALALIQCEFSLPERVE